MKYTFLAIFFNVFGIYRIIDMGHTALNVTGDMVSTLCIARMENLFQEDQDDELTSPDNPTTSVPQYSLPDGRQWQVGQLLLAYP